MYSGCWHGSASLVLVPSHLSDKVFCSWQNVQKRIAFPQNAFMGLQVYHLQDHGERRDLAERVPPHPWLQAYRSLVLRGYILHVVYFRPKIQEKMQSFGWVYGNIWSRSWDYPITSKSKMYLCVCIVSVDIFTAPTANSTLDAKNWLK